MWLIFIVTAIVIAIIMMVLFWIGNKIYISMRKDNHKFEKELKKEEGDEGK